jgi:hypothetical protein
MEKTFVTKEKKVDKDMFTLILVIIGFIVFLVYESKQSPTPSVYTSWSTHEVKAIDLYNGKVLKPGDKNFYQVKKQIFNDSYDNVWVK